MLKYTIKYKFTLLLAILISLLSLIPETSMPETELFDHPFLDKLVHLGMYGAIAFTALLETRCLAACTRKHAGLLLGLFLMGALIEVLQATCVYSRSAEWLDLLANTAGLVGGYTAYRIIRLLTS